MNINSYIIRITALFCSVLFSCGTIYAQNVKGTAIVDCPKEVVANKTFEYSIEIQPDSIIKVTQISPQFEKIMVMAGPYISTSTSITFRNGEKIKAYSQRYTYTLYADAGIHKIPTFQIKDLTGNYYNVPEVTIVSKETDDEPAIKTNNKVLTKKNNQKEKSKQNDDSNEFVADSTILVLSLDKSTVNVGETVLATVKLATRERVESVDNVKYDFDYCYIERIENTEPLEWETETINGIDYQVIPLLQYKLRPLQSGNIILHPIEIQLTMTDPSQDLVDVFFGKTRIQYIKKCVRSQKIVLNVCENNIEAIQETDKESTNDNLLVAIDASGSMRSYDFNRTRLDIAKHIVSNIKNNSLQTHILPFTSKYGNLIYDIDDINDIDSINIRDLDGSAMYDVGLFSLYNAYNGISYKDILLITDGNDNASHISRKTFTDLMAAYGVRVHIIIINSNKARVEADLYDKQNNLLRTEIDNEIADIRILKELAKSTGGECIEIKSELDVEDAISQISISIEKKAKKRRPSKLYKIENDMVNLIVTDYYNNNCIR